MSDPRELVWLIEERTYAVLVRELAYISLVRYTRAGIDFEVWIENDEYTREDHATDDE